MEPTSVWEGDNLLDAFLKNPISNHRPRGTTGSVYVQKEGNVMVVNDSDLLPKVLRRLTAEGFLGCPVVSAVGQDLVGYISLLDIVKYINGLFYGTSEDEWIDYFGKRLDFQLATARDIMTEPDEFNRSPIPALLKDFTSFAALEKMARTRVHAIVGLEETTEKISCILTQSMLISFLRQTKDKWNRSFRTLLVADFKGLKGAWRIKSIKEDDKAINAFLKMEEEEIHGMPVVNSDDVLVDAISVRDLRGVGTDGANFHRLYQTVATFKQRCRTEHGRLAPSSHYSTKPVPLQGVYVTASDTMEDVIRKMDDGNLHRVFICSQESHHMGKPKVTGVISQSDVLMQCLDNLIEIGSDLRVGPTISSPAGTGVSTRLRGRKSPPERKEAEVSPSRVIGYGRSPTKPSPSKRNIPISFD